MDIKQKIAAVRWVLVIWCCGFCLCSGVAGAHNISVSNVLLTGQNVHLHYTFVEFDIRWENSWRLSTGPSNWDAAWVFLKYRLEDQATWHHASLHYEDGTGTGDGHTLPDDAHMASSNDDGNGHAYGIFLYRHAELAQDDVNYPGVRLRWDYGHDGLADNDRVELCVFAIEMVYVPQGSFELGSGGGELDAFYRYPSVNSTFVVGSEAAIPVDTADGDLYYGSEENGGDQKGPIPAAFPKGYRAFYCMKYEITQGQYVSFLNRLSPAQAMARLYTGSSARYAITGSAPGEYVTANPHLPCNYLGWADLLAYLDWAALRPMSELEFEKACRGTLAPTANEYPWGSTNHAGGVYTLANVGLASESIAASFATSSGNALDHSTVGSIGGPVRAGIFAAHAGNTGRETAGASYYGIMELGGNLWDPAVTVGSSSGRNFTGRHGDGAINATGNADVASWPSSSGAGLRGGSWDASSGIYMHTSNRGAARFYYSVRANDVGGRGVRLAP